MTLYNLYTEADEKGIVVEYFPMQALTALALPQGNGCIAIDADKLRDSREEKSILAHEMGHIETGSFYNLYTPLDIREKHESRADKWAIKKLISIDELKEALHSGFTEIWELAEYFEVPCEFVEKATRCYQGELLEMNAVEQLNQ